MSEASRRLRALIEGPALAVMPGASNALAARLVEDAGFQAVYMTGYGTSIVGPTRLVFIGSVLLHGVSGRLRWVGLPRSSRMPTKVEVNGWSGKAPDRRHE